MLQQVVGATVDGLLSHHVVTGLGKSLQGIGDGSGARGDGEASNAALECGDTVLEDALGRVGQTAVNVTGVGKTKAVGGVLGVAEHIARGLVDRHGAGIGCGIGALLTNMKLQGVETKGVLGVVDELAHDELLDRTKVNKKREVSRCLLITPTGANRSPAFVLVSNSYAGLLSHPGSVVGLITYRLCVF